MAIATQVTIILALETSPKSVEEMINPDNVSHGLVNLINGIHASTVPGKILYHIDKADGTAASRHVVFTQASAVEGNTTTICGVVFTAMVATAPSTNPEMGQYSAITSNTVCGDNFVAAFNAHPAIKGLATATNSSGDVTITMATKGVHGNLGTLAASNAAYSAVAGAAFTSGAAGTVQKVLAVDQDSRTVA
jgi:hypothetical protein